MLNAKSRIKIVAYEYEHRQIAPNFLGKVFKKIANVAKGVVGAGIKVLTGGGGATVNVPPVQILPVNIPEAPKFVLGDLFKGTNLFIMIGIIALIIILLMFRR